MEWRIRRSMRIDIEDVTDHQPIEQHPERGEMLFDPGCAGR